MDDALKLPKQLPSDTHEVVVLLEAVHLPLEDLDTAPRSHELISYPRAFTADEIRERIQCASIVVAPQAKITPESLGEAKYLKFVVTPSAGTNHIDLDECRRRGIKVANCPGSTSLAVPEHALSLYFAARRKTVIMHDAVRSVDENGGNVWKRKHSAAYMMETANGQRPLALQQEVAGIIGYGLIGRGIEKLCRGLGMEVLILERKHSDGAKTGGSQIDRVPFEEGIRRSSVLFLCCTVDESARNTIDKAELALMRPEMVIVNVSRGIVMNTSAVVEALRSKQISGVAVDVFDEEPATSAKDSAFLAEDTRDLNLTFSPHVGYNSTQTISIMKSMVKQKIKQYVSGDSTGFAVK
ncbi:D-isomer specific 2-hydroxyacid dehydrogenase [Xylariaceae sp. FL0594]|nr:D-isomer specific 2-hydroxyacid dehydrogenase [Xylariaceae sp. FL0594]